MSKRRQALIGRFRSSALERLAGIRPRLERAAESGSAQDLGPIMGDLHTIKGEARMLGFAALSGFVHTLEQELQALGAATPEAVAAGARAVDVIGAALRGRLGDDDDAAAAALEEATADLAGGLSRFTWTPPASNEEHRATAADGDTPATPRWSRVEADSVDRVCDLVGELAWVLDRLRDGLQDLSGEPGAAPDRVRTLVEEAERARPRMEELEEVTWSLRLLPVEPELRDLAHHGEEIATRAGKRVRFTIDAPGAQLERQVLDALREPLLHLIRNAVDHGVEPPEARGDKPAEATVRVAAEAWGPTVAIHVEDDGRGIDADAVRRAAVKRGLVDASTAAELPDERVHELAFQPGFSTQTEASEISGRGVGLDVVRRRVEEVGGTLEVDSLEGVGTRFVATVPATVTREQCVVIECAGTLYGIPSRTVRRIDRRNPAREETVAGGRVLRDDDESLPLRSLTADLGLPAPNEEASVLALSTGRERWAWTVPHVLGEHDLIRRSVDPLLAGSGWLSGSSLLGDGRLVLLLRPRALRRTAPGERAPGTPADRRPSGRRRPTVLVVDDSLIIRDLLRELLEDAGLEVRTAEDGQQAVEALDRDTPDLLITDLEMPRLDGFGLLEAVRRRTQRLPVIVVSTRGSEEDRRRASSLGANAYLVKTGFEGTALLDTVARFVEVAA
ncbi:MAG: hybrid sensor histidine kinase/response regulator [Myxococcota bacterium]